VVRDGAGVAVRAEPMDLAEVAQLALGLPEAVEQDHHGMRSFRIDGKIFATLPDEQHVRIMLDQEDILAAVAEEPHACTEGWWGKRLACVVVEIQQAPRPLVTRAARRRVATEGPRTTAMIGEDDDVPLGPPRPGPRRSPPGASRVRHRRWVLVGERGVVRLRILDRHGGRRRSPASPDDVMEWVQCQIMPPGRGERSRWEWVNDSRTSSCSGLALWG